MAKKYHKKHRNEIGISIKTGAYIQSAILKKTLESISFDRRRGIGEEDCHIEVHELVSKISVETIVVKSVETQV